MVREKEHAWQKERGEREGEREEERERGGESEEGRERETESPNSTSVDNSSREDLVKKMVDFDFERREKIRKKCISVGPPPSLTHLETSSISACPPNESPALSVVRNASEW